MNIMTEKKEKRSKGAKKKTERWEKRRKGERNKQFFYNKEKLKKKTEKNEIKGEMGGRRQSGG